MKGRYCKKVKGFALVDMSSSGGTELLLKPTHKVPATTIEFIIVLIAHRCDYGTASGDDNVVLRCVLSSRCRLKARDNE